jgi:hypothetical protein
LQALSAGGKQFPAFPEEFGAFRRVRCCFGGGQGDVDVESEVERDCLGIPAVDVSSSSV